MSEIVDEMNRVAYVDCDSHLLMEVRNTLTVVTVADNQIDFNEKPVFCGILMNRQQIQQIIDNKHLFDSGLVNSAFLNASFVDNNVEIG